MRSTHSSSSCRLGGYASSCASVVEGQCSALLSRSRATHGLRCAVHGRGRRCASVNDRSSHPTSRRIDIAMMARPIIARPCHAAAARSLESSLSRSLCCSIPAAESRLCPSGSTRSPTHLLRRPSSNTSRASAFRQTCFLRDCR